MKKKQKMLLNHEALDRVAVISNNIFYNLEDHPGILANKKARKFLLKATNALYDCYQELGQLINK